MRKDVTEDWTTVAELLDRAEVVNLALAPSPETGDAPYPVPVNFARVGRELVIHSGRGGLKVRLLRTGQPCGFVAVPEAVEERTGSAACDVTYRFQSVIGRGVPREVTEPAERARLLNAIVEKHTRDDATPPAPVKEHILARTAIFSIRVDYATARRHRA